MRGANLFGAWLKKTDLSEANLEGADLTIADCWATDFARANLVGAKLPDAILYLAVFRGANLRGAILNSADLSFARIEGAILTNTDLVGTIFHSTWVEGVNFAQAQIGGTIFSDVDLSGALGLEDTVHHSPSTVGVDTLYRSQGRIAESFLRDVGVPEGIITQLQSLVGAQDGILFHSCFISFSFKDEAFARRLRGKMRDEKLRVWFAPEDGQGGKKLHEQIEMQIHVHDKLLLVLSEASMQSPWVAHEIYTARQREIREKRQILFPVALCPFEDIRRWKCFDPDSGQDLAREIRGYYIPNFSDWKHEDQFEAEFKKLLRDLKADAPPPAPAA